ncbi:MAG: glycosyltransferase family 4 protein [Cyanobacteria bacterium]|nr:glycosyltransferase family 4 protein [Cyanobacteriota bacterium]
MTLLHNNPNRRDSSASLQRLGGLVIVQNRETQFDAPLYRAMASSTAYPLRVIYTAPANSADSELGFAPRWDHLAADSYDHWVLRGQSLLQVWRLARWIGSLQPDLVIVAGYYPRFHLWLALLLRLLGQRIGLRSDNTLRHTPLRGWRGWLRRRVVGWIQRLFHSWHPVGDQALAYLRELSGSDRPSYRFAYAVDNDWFASRSAVERSGRAQWLAERGWPADAFVVLGILKWTAREDPLTLVRAFARLQGHCPRARLLLVGAGPLQTLVQQAIAAIAPLVHCPGYVAYSSLPQWYGYADVFVHPCPDEPWGVSVNEAMACGLPVLAAAGVGAGEELIEPGRNGLRFDNGDAWTLARQLQQLAEQPEFTRAMGAAALQTVTSWSYGASMAQMQQALQGAPCSAL